VISLLAVAVIVGTSAGAAITPSSSAADFAAAITSDPALVIGSSFVTKPPSGTPNAVSTTALTGFPTDGSSYAILTTGNATIADSPNSSGSAGADDGGPPVRGTTDFDVSILKIDLNVPAGANCLSFDFRFLTEEYPEYVGQAFNDAFIAELDTSNWSTSGSNISSPNNFAFDPSHNPISVNATGATTVNAANAAGTTYDGATPLLSALTPITPGHHSLFLSIFDQGDHDLDSAVFLDNLVVGATTGGSCKKGATTGGGVGGGGGKPFPVVSGPITGTVLIKLPGTNTFVPLKPGDPVPNGSEIDTTHGTVSLPAPGGSDVFYAGVFFVYSTFETAPRSPAGLAAKQQVVELRLAGASFATCGTRSPASLSKTKKPVRSLWGKGKGHFRTKARYGSATVRGTFWLTQDRCDGSFFSVKQGKVEVNDFVKHKKIVLTPGKSYLASPKKGGSQGSGGGSLTGQQALGLIGAILRQAATPCGITHATVHITGHSPNWSAVVEVTGSKASGKATWSIAGRVVTPTNALATTISRGCK
jgi:hypothetical protein